MWVWKTETGVDELCRPQPFCSTTISSCLSLRSHRPTNSALSSFKTTILAPRLDMPKVTQFRDSDWCLNGILILPFASTEDVARIFPSTLPDLQVRYRDCGSAEKPRWHAVNVNNWREAVEFRFCMIYCSLFVGKKNFLRHRVGLFSIFKQNSVQPWSSRHKPLRRKWWRKQPVQRRLASLYSVSMRM